MHEYEEIHKEIGRKIANLKVGQIWECIENKSNIIIISLVKPKEMHGFMFNGFQVVPFISLCLSDFVKYWTLIRERHGG